MVFHCVYIIYFKVHFYINRIISVIWLLLIASLWIWKVALSFGCIVFNYSAYVYHSQIVRSYSNCFLDFYRILVPLSAEWKIKTIDEDARKMKASCSRILWITLLMQVFDSFSWLLWTIKLQAMSGILKSDT